MGTITIRDLPDELVARVKLTAERHGRSMEEKIRLLLRCRFRSREHILPGLPARWPRRGQLPAEEIDAGIGANGQDG